VAVDGVLRYATPLLRKKGMPCLQAPKEAVMPSQRSTRVAEIQELTDLHKWHYVDSARNPADDITRGKTLKELVEPNRWSQGPPFLLHPPDRWPVKPAGEPDEESTFCGVTSTVFSTPLPDVSQCNTWKELL